LVCCNKKNLATLILVSPVRPDHKCTRFFMATSRCLRPQHISFRKNYTSREKKIVAVVTPAIAYFIFVGVILQNLWPFLHMYVITYFIWVGVIVCNGLLRPSSFAGKCSGDLNLQIIVTTYICTYVSTTSDTYIPTHRHRNMKR
jgi:hypothetical protein